MKRYYVVYSWVDENDKFQYDSDILEGDASNMEETLDKWYKKLYTKPEKCLTILNWKSL